MPERERQRWRTLTSELYILNTKVVGNESGHAFGQKWIRSHLRSFRFPDDRLIFAAEPLPSLPSPLEVDRHLHMCSITHARICNTKVHRSYSAGYITFTSNSSLAHETGGEP